MAPATVTRGSDVLAQLGQLTHGRWKRFVPKPWGMQLSEWRTAAQLEMTPPAQYIMCFSNPLHGGWAGRGRDKLKQRSENHSGQRRDQLPNTLRHTLRLLPLDGRHETQKTSLRKPHSLIF